MSCRNSWNVNLKLLDEFSLMNGHKSAVNVVFKMKKNVSYK